MRYEHIEAFDVAQRIAVTICIAALLLACSSERNEKIVPALLIADIESYQSVDAFLQKHPAASQDFFAEENKGPGSSGAQVTRLVVISFEHLGQKGQLDVSFFNDRLSGATFYPEQFEEYMLALEKSGINARNGMGSEQAFSTVMAGTDYKGRKYISWTDNRLRAEFNKFIND
jgi:hypothetical protein